MNKPLYGLVTLFAGVGTAETAYLTFLKLTASAPALCTAQGSCESVLASPWSQLAGVPMPALGLLTYGGMLALSISGATNKDSTEDSTRLALQFLATTAATTSLYLMVTLATKLEGQSCAYCYTSAALSALVLLSTVPGWKTKDIGSGAGVMVAVLLGLGVGFGDLTQSSPWTGGTANAANDDNYELVYKKPIVETVSSDADVALARHLSKVGAKFYGAFWCSHCYDQKVQFGAQAAELLPYVECFPDGYRKGVVIEQQCKAADISGFPTWVIDGKSYEGDQTFDQLAEASGFKQ